MLLYFIEYSLIIVKYENSLVYLRMDYSYYSYHFDILAVTHSNIHELRFVAIAVLLVYFVLVASWRDEGISVTELCA
jgi:hypothetical protein